MRHWQPLLLLFSIVIFSSAAKVFDGLLPNGGFEESPPQGTVNKTLQVPRWKINGRIQYVSTGTVNGGMFVKVPYGLHAVRLGSKSSISQLLNVEAGALYALTFAASKTCAQDEVLRISVPPVFGDLLLQMVYSSKGDAYGWGFRANSTIANVTFHNPGTQEDNTCGPLIDEVSVKKLRNLLPTKDNIVKNGDFEDGPVLLGNSSSGVLLPPKLEDPASPLPGWIIESLKAVKYIDHNHHLVPHGKFAVELVAGRESAIAQILRTVPGKKYNISFLIGDANNRCLGDMKVQAFAGTENHTILYKSEGRGGSKPANFQFKAAHSRTRITFWSEFYHSSLPDVTLCGPVLDRVRVSPLPY